MGGAGAVGRVGPEAWPGGEARGRRPARLSRLNYNQRSSQARERWWKGKKGGQALRRQSEVIGLTSLPSRVGLGPGDGGRARSRSQSRSEGEEGVVIKPGNRARRKDRSGQGCRWDQE